jgi:hypothetical protein
MYKIINDFVVQRLSDEHYIPRDPTNKDYKEFLEWEQKGNEPKPADVEPEPAPPTKEELVAQVAELVGKINSLPDSEA